MRALHRQVTHRCLVWDHRLKRDDGVFLASREQLLCMHDISVSRAIARYIARLSSLQGSVFVPGPAVIEPVFSWGDNILSEFGNKGYILIKELEPLCVGVYLKEYDVLPTKDDFLRNVLKGIPRSITLDPLRWSRWPSPSCPASRACLHQRA